MDISNPRLLDTTRSAFAEVLRTQLDALGDDAAGAFLRELEARLAHLLETAPPVGETVEQIRSLATIRASLHAAARQLEVENALR